jgi:hypothetical protein
LWFLPKEVFLDRRSVSVVFWGRCSIFLSVSFILVIHWVMRLVI